MRMRTTRSELPVALAGITVLMVKLGFLYLRLQVKSKRAERLFRRHLLRGGMSKQQARQLSEDYRGIASLRRILVANRVGIPFLR